MNPTARALAVAFVSATVLLAGFCAARPVRAAEDAGDELVVTASHVTAEEGPRGRVLTLRDSVTISMRGAVVTGREGRYFESESRAVVSGEVVGHDEGRSIAADTLVYLKNTDVVTLKGNASYSDSTGTTTADIIQLFRPENVAVCRGRVRFVDSDGRLTLTGDMLVYDFDRDEGRASSGPRLVTRNDQGEVDGTMTAAVIEFSPVTEQLTAFGHVVIEREELTARSETAVLERSGTMTLEGDPTVDRQGDMLSGTRIVVFGSDGEVSRVTAIGDALARYHIEPEEPGEEPASGVVTGDTLRMFIEDREPVLTTVRGNARSEHEVGFEGERNVVSSRAIDILFEDGRISLVTFSGAASGTYSFIPKEQEGAAPMFEEAAPPSDGAAAPADTAGLIVAPADTAGLIIAPADTLDLEVGTAGANRRRSAAASMDTVAYRGDKISYYVARNRIALTGDARVEYESTVLLADEVMFDPDGEYIEASGNPDLRENDERLVGNRLDYNLNENTGEIRDGVTTFEDGLYYGGRIIRESDGTLLVNRGMYTTCSDPEPHYSLVSHRMKIYMNDKVIAKPIILYIGKMPVLALPFYVFPIRRERHSGFLLPQIEFGFSQNKGRFVRNFGYYWAPNDYMDASVWADYYDQTRWIGHVEARYSLRYVLSGSATASFMQELLNNRRRWDLSFSHRQELGRAWTAGASGDFKSDATYASDTNESIQQIVNRSLHSQLWVTGRWSGHTVGVTLDRREDLDSGAVTELLPRAEFALSQRPLVQDETELPRYLNWLKDVSHNWSARLINDRSKSGEETVVHQGLGVRGGIRGTGKVLGWLSLSPRLSLEQDWYDKDKTGKEFPSRFTYSAGVSARTTIYGTFFPEKFGVQGVRHIVEPSASFSWTPSFSQYFTETGVDRFFSFSGFGSTPREQKSLSLGLVNKLQLKVGEGENVRRMDNFLRVSNATSYNFRNSDRPWSDVSTDAELRPGSPLALRWNALHDAYDGAILRSSLTATIDLTGQAPLVTSQPWEARVVQGESPADELREQLAARNAGTLPGTRPWDAALTFRYSRGADPSKASYWVDGGLAVSPSEKWRLDYAIHYDLEAEEVASQEFTIYRDLHCWEAQLTRRYYEGEWEYYFRIGVKAIPEIQAEAGSKFLQRRVR